MHVAGGREGKRSEVGGSRQTLASRVFCADDMRLLSQGGLVMIKQHAELHTHIGSAMVESYSIVSLLPSPSRALH